MVLWDIQIGHFTCKKTLFDIVELLTIQLEGNDFVPQPHHPTAARLFQTAHQATKHTSQCIPQDGGMVAD
jgi:hypothetical protein